MNAFANTAATTASISAEWKRAVAPYRQPHLGRSIWQIANTVGPYIGLWFLMVYALEISYWITLALALPASGFLMRSFIISHDCGHGAFFKSRRANTIVGTITALFAFTPYEQWRHEHAVHHASGGDLDHRGIGDIWTMTVEEYMNAPRLQRFRYRIHRSPWVLFTFGAFIQFMILQRFPRRPMSAREKNSIWFTDLLIAGVTVGLCLLIGWKAFLMIQIPVMILASSIGVWLFYVQHQFEGVHWSRHESWDFARGAVEGSSFYKLPPVLQWISGNIGFHHIHHLSPRIPNYYLEKCYKENPIFQEVSTITLRQSFKSATFRLWDEELQKLVGYAGVDAYRKRHGLAPGAAPLAT
ncbi:MAG: fatty acid desaturase [Candidatus Krumholzibacteria bacterium]|nr:fatty acid desaturase [Candidatus Krumholzibacteria bacterium]MDH4337882.1 fatty acid desaturase [Candidatus Krumholzibacteria bacterium]MDH5270233.1 fatty acid desaturase [Candidatus Krumholzibacteria bacterium]MDH5628367.1 fatty acid desaturase [Candidatus Krumholzibacteria bacterium]